MLIDIKEIDDKVYFIGDKYTIECIRWSTFLGIYRYVDIRLILDELSDLYGTSIQTNPLFSGGGSWPTGDTRAQLKFIRSLLDNSSEVGYSLLSKKEKKRITKLNKKNERV